MSELSRVCGDCGGTGFDFQGCERVVCEFCKGWGRIFFPPLDNDDFFDFNYSPYLPYYRLPSFVG